MEYNYKSDYNKHVFDTPAKKEQEIVIVNKIMDLLNRNTYDNIENFITKNNTYEEFLKNNHLENVVKHFGNTLNDEDYSKILEQMKKITELKQSFNREEIKTTNLNSNEYNSYKGKEKTFFFDNSSSNMSLERQMEELQKTENKFQTIDSTQNTENMMKELEENKKQSLNLKYLNEIDYTLLNDEEKLLYEIVNKYQQSLPYVVKVDLEKKVIVDENDNIMEIQNNNGEISIISEHSNEKVHDVPQKTYQKKLIPPISYVN